MMMFDILEAMCDTLHEKFTASPIYIRKVPQGFNRPSFHVGMAGFHDTDASNKVLYRTIAFDVVYFAPKDDDDTVDTVAQYAAYATMAQLFQHQNLKVKDNYIKITSVDGAPRDAEIYLTINFEYLYVPEDVMNPADMYELIQNLEMKYNQI